MGATSVVAMSSFVPLSTKGLGYDGQRVSDHIDGIPIIDVSLLISNDPKDLRKLGRACDEWGFFLAINHKVSDGLMTRILDACRDFFNMTEDEKQVYSGKNLLESLQPECIVLEGFLENQGSPKVSLPNTT